MYDVCFFRVGGLQLAPSRRAFCASLRADAAADDVACEKKAATSSYAGVGLTMTGPQAGKWWARLPMRGGKDGKMVGQVFKTELAAINAWNTAAAAAGFATQPLKPLTTNTPAAELENDLPPRRRGPGKKKATWPRRRRRIFEASNIATSTSAELGEERAHSPPAAETPAPKRTRLEVSARSAAVAAFDAVQATKGPLGDGNSRKGEATAAVTAFGVTFPDLLRRRVRKSFGGFGEFTGTIISQDSTQSWYTVKYEDGDEEEYTLKEVKELLIEQMG